jgi:heme/copper-type cytochrome/quinol oxidase subunit 1
MLIADRLVSTHFFTPAGGRRRDCCSSICSGSSAIPRSISSSCRRRHRLVDRRDLQRRTVFGYSVPMVLAMIGNRCSHSGCGSITCSLVGLPRLGNDFYTAASMAIAVPAGLQIFCWLATVWSGRPASTPILWVIGFIATFVIGGLSGVMVASVPLDLQLTDTYFVVAHLHYVLVGGAMFPLFGAFCYWYPKSDRAADVGTLGDVSHSG